VFLLKSRFGTSDICVPFNFFGDCSHYVELPKPEEIYDYEKYTNPNYLLKDTTLDNTIKTVDESSNNDFNFVL
jgi:hypothetical protein